MMAIAHMGLYMGQRPKWAKKLFKNLQNGANLANKN